MRLNYVLTTLNSVLSGIVYIWFTITSLFAQTNLSQNTPNSVQPNSVNTTLETKNIGIRKIYAPETQIQKWPLGDNKYIYISEDKFQQQYDKWKNIYDIHNDISKDKFAFHGLYISTAQYVGKLEPSGELTGQGEWHIKHNREFNNSSENNTTISEQFLLLPNMQAYMEELSFTPSTDKPSTDNQTQENNSILSTDSSQFLFGALPSGQQIFYSPNDGLLKFKWTAIQKEADKYVLQSPPGMVSQWQLTVPDNKNIIVTNAHTNQRLPNVVISTPAQDSSSDSENKTNTYTFYLANAECVYIQITDTKQSTKQPNLLYQLDSQYTFYPYQLSTVSTITFTIKDKTTLPTEIPFKVIHNPNQLWRAKFDGKPIEVHTTDTGYYISLIDDSRNSSNDNTSSENNIHKEESHVLTLTNTCTMEELSLVNQTSNNPNNNSNATVKYPLPRIELENGIWVSSFATCNTIQKPMGISSNFGKVSEFKITPKSRYITNVTLFNKQADIFITFSPFCESFYSQNDTIVHWDGSQLTFTDSIYLWAEQGNRYVLTAPLPERLTVDRVQISANSINNESIDINNWEIQTDEQNPQKQVLYVYLRESIRPGHSLTLDIQSHIITSLTNSIAINMLQPILFDGFTPHRQSVQVNVDSNQKFTIADRVIYSPDKNETQKSTPDIQAINLPDGIVQIPLPDNDTKTDKNQSNTAFIINVKKWGEFNTTISTPQQGIVARGEFNISIQNQTVCEQIELKLSEGSTRLKTFHFELASEVNSSSADKSNATKQNVTNWNCILSTSDKEFRVPVTEESENHFVIEFPINIATPFTLKLSRKFQHNGTYQTHLIKTPDCNSITVLTTIHTDPKFHLEMESRNIEQVTTQAVISNDSIAGQYFYQQNYSDNNLLNHNDLTPYLSFTVHKKAVSTEKETPAMWAWSQQINEYHFGSGSILVSAEWDIENRFPPQCETIYSNRDKNKIYWTIPNIDKTDDISSKKFSLLQENNFNQTPHSFITGLWIDNVLIPSTDIEQHENGVFAIPAPVNKKRFTLTVQWTLYNKTLSSLNHFNAQTPTLRVPVFQSKWNVYYPTTYRQLLSFKSSDSTVDGFFPRLFGPLIRNESNTLNFVTHLLDGNINSSSTKTEATSSNPNTEQNQQQYTVKISSNASLNSLTSPNSWNCYSFTDNSTHPIYIIRNEVSECLRWSFFIVFLCLIFSLCRRLNTTYQEYNSDSSSSTTSSRSLRTNNLENNAQIAVHSEKITPSVLITVPDSQVEKNKNQLTHTMTESKIHVHSRSEISTLNTEKPQTTNLKFRRWLVCMGLISAILAQILPWIISIPFSALFMSSMLSLLVFGMQTKHYGNSHTHNSLGSLHKSEMRTNNFVWFIILIPTILIASNTSVTFGQDHSTQYSNQPNTKSDFPSDSVYQNNAVPNDKSFFQQSESSFTTQQLLNFNHKLKNDEYQIFILTDKTQQSQGYCYVPQGLMEIINNTNIQGNNRSWMTYQATYVGQLFEQMNRIETSVWTCSLEIETFQPNTAIELPTRMKDSFFSISDITIQKKIKENTGSDKNSNQDNSWVWGSPIKSTPQWDEQHQNWFFKIVQPGRYLIKIQFQPKIDYTNGKNEISFPIASSMNTILELTIPDTISDLEFPNSIGTPKDITLDADNNTIQPESKLITKRVILGATQQLTCRWNTNQSTVTDPSYYVDTLSWWHIHPDHSTLKVHYNLHVESGTVSSIGITVDPQLTLLEHNNEALSPFTEEVSKENNSETNDILSITQTENQDVLSTNTESITTQEDNNTPSLQSVSQSDAHTLIVPSPNSELVPPPIQHDISTNEINPTSPILSIVPDKLQKNLYIVTFKTPIRTQTSFDLDFTWNHSSIGAPQYPTTVFPDKHTGRKLLAFTVDPKLQLDWSSSTQGLTTISSQDFFTHWSNTNEKNTTLSPTMPQNGTVISSSQTLVLPPPPKTENEILETSQINIVPDIAFDLNQLKRKNESTDNSSLVCLNIQPVSSSAQAHVDAFILTYENKLLCQFNWNIVSTKGERSGYCIELPEPICTPQGIVNIIAATVSTDKRSYNASAYLHDKTLELYWGTPISGNCTVELLYELKIEPTDNSIETQFQFEFPKLKNVDVTKYKFTLSRTDDIRADIKFNSQEVNKAEFSLVETPVEPTNSDRHQQVVGSWETPTSNLFPQPVPFLISVSKNNVQATLSYSATLLLENQPTLIINGIVNVEKGILDEITFCLPEYYGVPISSKASMGCQLNTDSITSNSYYLRPQLPFTSGTEFQLSIPLEASSKQWKIEPIQFTNVTVTRAIVTLPENQKESPIRWETIPHNTKNLVIQNNNDNHSLIDTTYIGKIPQTSQKWCHLFDLKYNIHTVSEYQYYTSVEFAVIQTGEKQIQVTLPDNNTVIDVQIMNRSVQWRNINKNTILIPIFSENELFDVRIIYSCNLPKTLYSEPIVIDPIHIANTNTVPSANWTVIPLKKFNKISTTRFQQKNFLQKQNLILSDLIAQMSYIQNQKLPISEITLTRFQILYYNIEKQINQFLSHTKNATENAHYRVSFKELETLRNKYNTILLELKNNQTSTLSEPFNNSNQTETDVDVNTNLIPSDYTVEGNNSTTPIYAFTDADAPFMLELNIRSGVKPWKPIWWILATVCIPIFIWLSFFPPLSFVPWRPSFTLGTLGIFWLLEFNLYGIAILLLLVAFFDFLKKLRRLSRPNIVPLKVR